MIHITTSATDEDLSGIMNLQRQNLAAGLSADEIQQQGFLTVQHSLAELQQMHRYEKNIIAKENDTIAGYLLAMPAQSSSIVPILEPMFALFDSIEWKGRPVAAYRYMVVGQVCIAKAYRGRGLLDGCYAAYRSHFMPRYDFAITEIATTNRRSVSAHQRIGFKEIHRYTSTQGVEWSIVLWDWHAAP